MLLDDLNYIMANFDMILKKLNEYPNYKINKTLKVSDVYLNCKAHDGCDHIVVVVTECLNSTCL